MNPLEQAVHELGNELDRCRTVEDIQELLKRGIESPGDTPLEVAIENHTNILDLAVVGGKISYLVTVKYSHIVNGSPEKAAAVPAAPSQKLDQSTNKLFHKFMISIWNAGKHTIGINN